MESLDSEIKRWVDSQNTDSRSRWICFARTSSPHDIDRDLCPGFWSDCAVEVLVAGKCKPGDLLTGTIELACICKAGEPLSFFASRQIDKSVDI
jgi:hypothetical protein